jgi:hypothetical protein
LQKNGRGSSKNPNELENFRMRFPHWIFDKVLYLYSEVGTMSTKVTLKYESDEAAGGWFQLYREIFDKDEYVYLEFGGVPFEAASSMDLSDKGPTSVSTRRGGTTSSVHRRTHIAVPHPQLHWN